MFHPLVSSERMAQQKEQLRQKHQTRLFLLICPSKIVPETEATTNKNQNKKQKLANFIYPKTNQQANLGSWPDSPIRRENNSRCETPTRNLSQQLLPQPRLLILERSLAKAEQMTKSSLIRRSRSVGARPNQCFE